MKTYIPVSLSVPKNFQDGSWRLQHEGDQTQRVGLLMYKKPEPGNRRLQKGLLTPDRLDFCACKMNYFFSETKIQGCGQDIIAQEIIHCSAEPSGFLGRNSGELLIPESCSEDYSSIFSLELLEGIG